MSKIKKRFKEIPKGILEELYTKRRLSPYKIAELLDCEYTTIRRRLRKHGIKSTAKNLPIELPKKRLRELYLKNKLSISKIAKIYHCSSKPVRRWLNKYKIKIRPNGVNIKKRVLIRLYKKGRISTIEVGKILKCSPSTIWNKLLKYNIKLRPNKRILPKKGLVSSYTKKKYTIKKICKLYKCSENVIYKNLKLYKIKSRKPDLLVDIPKNDLIYLYIKKRLSSVEIAKKFNCTPPTVRYKLKKFDIPIRARTSINISKKDLNYLYTTKKLSTMKIAKKLNYCDDAIRERLHKYNIRVRSNVENSTLYKKHKFTGSATEKSYLVGFRLGDLYVEKQRKNGKTLCIKCGTTKQEQIDLIKKLFSKYGGTWVSNPDKRGARQVYGYVDMSFSFLLDKKDEIPLWILSNKNNFFAFFAGYLDAEGHIEIDKKDCAKLGVWSYDKNILKQLYQCLNYYGIYCLKPKITRKKGYEKNGLVLHRKDTWGLGVYRKKDLLEIFNNVSPYLKHEKRCKDMEKAKINILERNKKFGGLKSD